MKGDWTKFEKGWGGLGTIVEVRAPLTTMTILK